MTTFRENATARATESGSTVMEVHEKARSTARWLVKELTRDAEGVTAYVDIDLRPLADAWTLKPLSWSAEVIVSVSDSWEAV